MQQLAVISATWQLYMYALVTCIADVAHLQADVDWEDRVVDGEGMVTDLHPHLQVEGVHHHGVDVL